MAKTEPRRRIPQLYREYVRPGPGWEHIAGAVWDHVSGVRLHTGGMIRTPDGHTVSAHQWPESKSVARAVRITGSRRRGMMVWALWCLHHRMGETSGSGER